MKISVFGLGYVGVVSAGCLAGDGHEVIGVDTNPDKVRLINDGRSPIIERDIAAIIADAVQAARLSATADAAQAVAATTLSLVCVGTPSAADGALNLDYVRSVCEEIGTALRSVDHFHVVAVRSTMLPGSVESVVIPALEAFSGRSAGRDFGVCINPEFMREGSSVDDYRHPPKIIIGESDDRAGDIVAALYAQIDAPLIRTSLRVAEVAKYADNAWHALKVGFANEIGNICKASGIDSHEVMDIFCRDTKLNISPSYLRPGFAFGGSCLPKDVRALLHRAASLDVPAPILQSILPSNAVQVARGVEMVVAAGNARVGVMGLSFKAGTDDLRESPMVELIERLIGENYEVRIHDDNVRLAGLVGANRDYILNHIPHISGLLVDDPEELVAHSDTIVIGNAGADVATLLQTLPADKHVIDFIRVENAAGAGGYEGICW